MARDDELRRLERAAAAAPDDGEAWARLSLACERAGRAGEAARAATRAARLAPGDAARRARLVELGRGHGLWPSERGDAGNRQASPLHGPDEGVMRWRLPLPRDPVGRPLVDLEGRVLVRCAGSLLRVDPDGRGVAPLAEWTPGAALAASLRAGAPAAFDVLGGTPFGPERPAQLCNPLHAAARGAGAFAVDRGGLVALDADGALVWRRPLAGRPVDLAAGPDGPVVALTAAPDEARPPTARLVALEGATGRVAWTWGDAAAAGPRDLADVAGGPAPTGPLHGGPAVAVAASGEVLAATAWRRPFVDGPEALAGGVACLGPGGARRWWRKLDAGWPPALHGDRVVVAGPDAALVLDLASGEPRASVPVRGANAPTLDGRGVLYLTTGEGQVLAVGPDGAPRFRLLVRGTGRLGALALGDDGWGYAFYGRELIAFR